MSRIQRTVVDIRCDACTGNVTDPNKAIHIICVTDYVDVCIEVGKTFSQAFDELDFCDVTCVTKFFNDKFSNG